MIRAIILISAYIAAQMLADISSLKIIYLFGLSMDAGTLIYPITFTLRDLVHRVLDKKHTVVLIFSAAAINLFMAGFFWLVSVLPPDMSVGVQKEFGIVLSPVWRIVIASIIAEVVAELIDTEMYSLWKSKFQDRHLWGRVLASNAIAVPIDSIIFAGIAFLGVFPLEVVLSIVVANIVIKGVVSILSAPAIYATN